MNETMENEIIATDGLIMITIVIIPIIINIELIRVIVGARIPPITMFVLLIIPLIISLVLRDI